MRGSGQSRQFFRLSLLRRFAHHLYNGHCPSWRILGRIVPTPSVYLGLTGMVQQVVNPVNPVRQWSDAGEFNGVLDYNLLDNSDFCHSLANWQQETQSTTVLSATLIYKKYTWEQLQKIQSLTIKSNSTVSAVCLPQMHRHFVMSCHVLQYHSHGKR